MNASLPIEHGLLMTAAFWFISLVTVLGALLAVCLRNLIHSVLALILFFLGVAAHYFLLSADFVGAVQILVYIGAVAVLILFAIMLTRNITGTETTHQMLGGKWWAGTGAAAILGGLLCGAILRSDLTVAVAEQAPSTGIVERIGTLLVSQWVAPLEAMAVLLTATLIGAVVIALEETGK